MEFLRKRVLVKRQTINGQGNELVTTELNLQHPLVVKALAIDEAEDEPDEEEPWVADDADGADIADGESGDSESEWQASENGQDTWDDDEDVVDEPQPPNLENRSARPSWQITPHERRY
jgi:hypothetical protein